MQNIINYYSQEEIDKDININFKKIFLAIWSRKNIVINIFCFTLLFFVILTFILPKKWVVDANLYINKSNNTNMAEVNPYFIEEVGLTGGMAALMSGGNANLLNEVELMQSPLVIDKVIKENDLRFKKLFGTIPTAKTGEYLTTQIFLKKGLTIEVKKGTNVVSISYKSNNKELAYSIVTSIIANYMDLRKELTSEKSKSDKKILEAEYNKVRADLDKKIKKANGLPANAISGVGNLAALSAFSKSASQAISSMQGQFIAGEKSQIALKEDSEKLTQLSSKLQWARLVDEMSDSSKILILKEPKELKNWEYVSPKLLINIFLGVILGALISIIAVFIQEFCDKKLSYIMLGNNVIYDLKAEFKLFTSIIYSNENNKTAIITFNNISNDIGTYLEKFKNIQLLKADFSEQLFNQISQNEKFVLLLKINQTNTEDYKLIKQIIENNCKQIICEVLI